MAYLPQRQGRRWRARSRGLSRCHARAAFNQRAQHLDADFLGPIGVVDFDELVGDLIVVLFAQTLDSGETEFRIGIAASDVEQDRNYARTTV